MDIIGEIRNLAAEIPDNIGDALVFIGEKLEALAARIDALEAENDAAG